MKTKILLFALLCGAALTHAADSPLVIASKGDATTSGTINLFHAADPDSPLSWPMATITWDHPNPDKSDPYKFNQPTRESAYTLTMDEGFKLSIAGHVLVTTREAADVVKAMEILSRWASTPWDREAEAAREATYAVMRFRDDSPEGLRRQADALEDELKARVQTNKDLAWARSILELWKKKLEGAK